MPNTTVAFVLTITVQLLVGKTDCFFLHFKISIFIGEKIHLFSWLEKKA